MIFEKVRYKNFLSTGNAFTEIVFNKNQNTLIVGKNGAGKCVRGSTEVDVLISDKDVLEKFNKFMEKR